jgi:hypothetical protein
VIALKSLYIDFMEREFGLLFKVCFVCFLKLLQK